MQRSRNFFSVVVTTFQNAPILYGRQVFDAIRELTRKTYEEENSLYDKYRKHGLTHDQAKELATKDVILAKSTAVVRLLTYGWLMQFFWVLVSDSLPYIFGGGDDDKNLWVESIKNPAVWIGPLQGVTFGSNLISAAEGYPLGGPMLFEDVGRFWNKYGKAAQDQGVFSAEAAGIALDLLAELSLSQNTETFFNMYNGVKAFMDGHATAGVLQLINAPRSQIKKILMKRGDNESLMQYAERVANLQDLLKELNEENNEAFTPFEEIDLPPLEEMKKAN